ncbi:MAG: PhoU domain-containing protein, partial [Campylobacteraceae bacterium]
MLARHIEKLEKIRADLLKFGSVINESCEKMLKGLETQDEKEFENARATLKNIDSSANSIDNEIVTSLALFGAEATELRELVSYLKVTNELVRISESIKSFTKNISNHMASKEIFDSYKDYAIQLCKCSV